MLLPYILITFIGIGSISLIVYVIVDLISLKQKEKSLQKEQAHIDQNDSEVITKAQAEANDIIKKAVQKAEETLRESKIFRDDLVEELNKTIREVAENTLNRFKQESSIFDRQYQQLFSSIQEEYTRKTKLTIDTMQKTATDELEDFKQILRNETISSQNIISTKIQEEFNLVLKDIQTYRTQKIQEINASAKDVTKKITEDLLGKALSLSEHEQLITQALESAKKEGMFNG